MVIRDATSTVYDTGWVESSKQSGIKAQNLKSETVYYWTVNVKDQYGNESGFAPEPSFETIPDVIQGKWIGKGKLFRKVFILEQSLENIERARSCIGSPSMMEIHLNGQKVGKHVLGPRKPVANQEVYFNTYDIFPLLQEGTNALGLMCSSTWAKGDAACGMLKIWYKDGTTQVIATDTDWQMSNDSFVTRTTQHEGEDENANLMVGWDTVGYNNFDYWENAVWNGEGLGRLAPSNVGTVIIDETRPVNIYPSPGGNANSYILDFGKNMAGYVRVNGQLDKGQVMDVAYSELVNEEGNIFSNTTRWYPICKYTFSGGVDVFEPHFFYTGFRYVEVTNDAELTEDILRDMFIACFVSDDVSVTGVFESSNERRNAIYDLYYRAQRSNMVGIYTDCPQREKNAWLGDASVVKEAASIMLGDYTTAESFGQIMKLSPIDTDGSPFWVVPRDSVNTSWADADTSWCSAFFTFPCYTYLQTGDSYYVEQMYDTLVRVFNFYQKKAGDDYIYNWTRFRD